MGFFVLVPRVSWWPSNARLADTFQRGHCPTWGVSMTIKRKHPKALSKSSARCTRGMRGIRSGRYVMAGEEG
jgi:hypothetical protein